MSRRIVTLAALLLAVACDGPSTHRAACGDGDPCGPQEYCARTPDGNVCWPDLVPPTIQSVAVTCPTPCLRDGALTVTAQVSDDKQLGAVSVTLDLAPGQPVALARSGAGSTYSASVPLASLPFPFFERTVVATVTAEDEAQNTASLAAPAGQRPMVTRLKWSAAVDPGTVLALGAPAVAANGTVVATGNNGKIYFVTPDGGAARAAVAIGSGSLGVPAISGSTIWAGSTDGKLYAVALDGTPIGNGCSTGAAVTGAPAVVGNRVVAGSGGNASNLAVADVDGFCDLTSTNGAIAHGPVVTTTGQVVAATGATLRAFALPANGVLSPSWTGEAPAPSAPLLEGAASAPLAVDAAGTVWSIALSGKLNATTLAAATENPFTATAGSSGPVVLADGSVVVGDANQTLRRFRSPAPPWTESGPVTGVPTTPLVLGGARPNLVAGTSTGWIVSVDAGTGAVVWTHKLSATGNPLQPPNLYAAPGAATSTAYLAGGDGRLYAVVVDGALDAAAPWPKAFHDPRNTSHVGTTP